MIAGVRVVSGCGTSSRISYRSRREKGKALQLDWPRGMIRLQLRLNRSFSHSRHLTQLFIRLK